MMELPVDKGKYKKKEVRTLERKTETKKEVMRERRKRMKKGREGSKERALLLNLMTCH